MAKALLSRVSWLLLGRFVAAGLQAGQLVILARYTGLYEFSSIAFMLGIAVFIHALMDVGASTFLVKLRASNPASAKIFEALRLSGMSSFFVSCFLVVIAFIYSLVGKVEYPFAYLLILWLLFERLGDTWLSILQADGRNNTYTIYLIFRRAFSLVVFCACVLLSDIEESLLFSASLASAAIITYSFLRLNIRKIINLSAVNGYSKGLLMEMFPFWINSALMQMRNLDVLVVTIFLGPVGSAPFSTAARLIAPMNIIPSSMAAIILPSLSKKEHEPVYYLKLAVFATIACAIPILIMVAALPFLVGVLLGDSFVAAVTTLQIATCSVIVLSLSTMTTAILQARDQAATASRISAFVTIGYLVSLAFFSKFGAEISALMLALWFGIRTALSVMAFFRGLNRA